MQHEHAPEQRTIDVDVEDIDTRGRTLHGYAAVYNVESEDLGGFQGENRPRSLLGCEVEDLIDAGDQVVSVQTSHARGRASGVAVDLAHTAAAWTSRQGRIVPVALFTNRAEALEAVGLWE